MAYITKATEYLGTTPELYPSFDLFKTLTKIYVKPSTLIPGEALVIDRLTEDINLEYLTTLPTPSTRIPIIGVMGIVRMIPCKYLIVIEEKARVGPEPDIKPHLLSNTWRVEKVRMLPVAPGKRQMTSEKARLNDRYELTMLEILNSKTFYFSYDFDLSHSIKGISQVNLNVKKPGMFLRTKKMFIWNFPILLPFLKLESASQYVVPVVNGFVGTSLVIVKNVKVFVSLVSRRRRSRSGKRYFCRGINSKGYCANFVESEMILEIGKTTLGFVLTRGSLPFYWMQWPNLSFNPKPYILYSETNDYAFDKHIQELSKEYGYVYMVDMINRHDLPKLYVEFKHFMKQCIRDSKQRDRLTLLNIDLFNLDWASDDLHDFEVYGALRDMMSTVLTRSIIKQLQKGVFHVCSIDGTDLADVMQFSLARTALLELLLYAEYSKYGDGDLKDPKQVYKDLVPELSRLWLSNSDTLALYYVGTKSLNSQFYSTNVLPTKQTFADLCIQIRRWIINNFKDGDAHDCIEILTRKSTINSIPYDDDLGYVRSIMRHVSWITQHVALPFGAVFTFLNLIFMYKDWTSLCSIQWLAALFYCTYMIYKNRCNFVNTPTLTMKPNINKRPSDWYYQ